MTLDAVVVGSGPNGLSAAITLAREGLSVLVLEAAEVAGGGARSAELTLPGFVHDTCAAILPLAFASPAFAGMPLERHGLRWIFPPAPLAHAIEPGRAVLLPRAVEDAGASLGPDGRAWRELFEPLARDWPLLARDVLGPLAIPRHPIALARFGWNAIRSADGLARSRFSGDEARALFAGLAAHSFLPLDRLATASFALVLGLLAHVTGWPFPEGGAGALSRALVAHLEELGGRVELSRRVSSLSELPASRAVILDVGPPEILRICRDRLPARHAAALRRYRYGPGAFKLDWALDGPIPWSAPSCAEAGVVHVGGTLGDVAEAERAPWEGRVASRPFVLVAQQSLFDATRAPSGRQVGWAYCHVPPAWSGDAGVATELIEAQVERHAPGFRDRILARCARGPAQLEAGNANLVGGDINGGVQDLGQMFMRPTWSLTPHALPVPGLYQCSSSTPPGGGVHGLGGLHAARLALRRTFGVTHPKAPGASGEPGARA